MVETISKNHKISPLDRGYEEYKNRVLRDSFGVLNPEELKDKILSGGVGRGEMKNALVDFISKKNFETGYYFYPSEILSQIRIKEKYESVLLTDIYKDISALGVFVDGRVVVGRENGDILLLGSVDGGVPLRQIGRQKGKVCALILMPDGDIYSLSKEREIVHWKMNFDGSYDKNHVVTFDRDGDVSVVMDVASDGSIVISEYSNSIFLNESKCFKLVNNNGVYKIFETEIEERLNFCRQSNSGGRIETHSEGIYNYETGETIWQVDSDIKEARLLPDGRIVYATKSEVTLLK
jgi:hypothetical protein